MKYSQWIGVMATLLLVAACFMPWAYYPDLKKEFTGFFTEKNIYGKPGKVFIFLAVFAIAFFLISKTWAKRWNLLIAALTVAFAIKSFILFSGCYNVYCPERRIGLWLMLISSIVLLLMTLLPSVKTETKG